MKNTGMKTVNYQSIDDIKEDPVLRIPTGLPEIDWIYGVTQKVIEGRTYSLWGLPVGKMSVWVAPGGVGKSRALIELAKSVSSTLPPGSKGDRRYTSLYFQSEAPLGEFKSWATKGGLKMDPKHFMVSDANTLTSQLRVIHDMASRGLTPQLIIVDSINMMREFGRGTEENVKDILLGPGDEEGYKDVVSKYGCHVIFVSQTNKAGEAKGSNSLPHLVDQTFNIEKIDASIFSITTGKSRYSRSGTHIRWKHEHDCARCCSTMRYGDDLWLTTNGKKKNNFSSPRKKVAAKPFIPKYLPPVVQPIVYEEEYFDDIDDYSSDFDDSPLAECERTMQSAGICASLGLGALAYWWGKNK